MTERSERVHVVIERADGSRIVRLPAPRWLASVAVGLGGLVLVTIGALYTDYSVLKRQREQYAALEAQVAEQQTVIDGFQEHMTRLRTEVDGWRELDAKIWQPFGPEAGPGAHGTGVGGGTTPRLAPPPGPSPSAVEELDRLSALATEEGDSLRALERFMSRAGKVLAALPSRWPVRGPVNSEFGTRDSPWSSASSEFHSGLDIGAARGTPVAAPAAGTVVFAGQHPEYGITLIIDHGHDIKSLYGHLSRLLVAVDQNVQRGQVIALTGNTGRSSGPHLHYEIQVAGHPANPRSYLWD